MAKMKTTRVNKEVSLFPITNKQEADEQLRLIGELTLKLQELEGEANRQINVIKADLELDATPLQEEIERRRLSLESYATNNRTALFGKSQSIKLQFGQFGWRKGKAAIETAENTLELIKKKMKDLVSVLVVTTESVDKKALGKLTDEQLAKVDARRVVKQRFFVEPELKVAADYSNNA